VIFATYAENAIWTAVHLGQFLGMAVMLAGLFVLDIALDAEQGAAKWTARFGAGAAVAALALYGVLQAVDGVALKQAVNAWVSAPEAEKAARFASAESIRWLEWGMRSYQNFAMGLALLLSALAVAQSANLFPDRRCPPGPDRHRLPRSRLDRRHRGLHRRPVERNRGVLGLGPCLDGLAEGRGLAKAGL